VFGRDMILNIKHTANWDFIRQRKQNLINKNNLRENAKHIDYVYKLGESVLLKRGTENKYEAPYSGPHKVLKVNNNGTVRLKVKSVTDTYNIRRLLPYHETNNSNHGGECNMQNSKKRRKKQSRVMPAGESNVNQNMNQA
jgi:hypothetical protein